MTVMRYVHVREVNHGDFKELEDLYQATRKDTPDKRATREAKDKDSRDASKKRLPCWYLGGTMNGPCCAANAQPAGVMQIDRGKSKPGLRGSIASHSRRSLHPGAASMLLCACRSRFR